MYSAPDTCILLTTWEIIENVLTNAKKVLNINCLPYAILALFLLMLSTLPLCLVHKSGPQMISLLLTMTLVLTEVTIPETAQLVVKDGFNPSNQTPEPIFPV